MEEINDKYKQLETLGEGTYGVVWKALDIEKKTPVAIKKIKKNADDEGISCSALREITVLRNLQHENIVTLLDVNYTGKSLF